MSFVDFLLSVEISRTIFAFSKLNICTPKKKMNYETE